MKNEKVIVMGSGKITKERIADAAAQAEQRYQDKVSRSRASDVDVRDFFDDEELERILQSNDFFTGKIADFSQLQKFNKLKMAAAWLDAHCLEVVKTEVVEPSKSRPNTTITVEVRRLASLRGKEKQVFASMQVLADTVFMSGLKDDVIRFTFGIEGVWK